ncbi:MAG: hypothetical protein QY307_04115 [Acidimicrobiia bacterium]|nr:MAG: hypothetical protein QY307_04115 [Acidimicrobiia bacterium]
MPQWIQYLIGGAAALAVIGVVWGVLLKDDGEPVTASTSTTVVSTTEPGATTLPPATTIGTTTTTAQPTTSEATTTTEAPTTTTTTTIPGIGDQFDGPTAAVSPFDASVVTVEVMNGRAEVTAGTTGVIPVLYPEPFGDAIIEMRFRSDVGTAAGAVGVMLFADDPSDGSLTDFLVVEVREIEGTILVAPFLAGAWGDPVVTGIPAGAAFLADDYNVLSLETASGVVRVSLNSVLVTEYAGPVPTTSGRLGFLVTASAAGNRLVVDYFTVEPR